MIPIGLHEPQALSAPFLYESALERTVLAMLLLAGLSQAIIGIWQFGLRGDGPEHFEILEGILSVRATGEERTYVVGADWKVARLQGTIAAIMRLEVNCGA